MSSYLSIQQSTPGIVDFQNVQKYGSFSPSKSLRKEIHSSCVEGSRHSERICLVTCEWNPLYTSHITVKGKQEGGQQALEPSLT